jgi:putative DNA primase/helicase
VATGSRPIIKPRVLGLSETRRIENTVTIFGNGNNFQLVGDMLRRVILCSFDANLERPELRQFCSCPGQRKMFGPDRRC